MPLTLPYSSNTEEKKKKPYLPTVEKRRDWRKPEIAQASYVTTPKGNVIPSTLVNAPVNHRNMLTIIYNAYQQNSPNADQLYQGYMSDIADPTSTLYDPYREPTNIQPMQTLASLGYDVSDPAAFLEQNKGLSQYYRFSVDGSPLAPTKKSSPQEIAAYSYWKLAQDEAPTVKVEEEVNRLYNEVYYWAQRKDLNYSDEEILAKVNLDKYPALKALEEGKKYGKPVALNRPVAYNEDALLGVIWSARSGENTGDPMANAVNYALGRGTQYKDDPAIRARRDPTSEKYNPYLLGSTLDEEAAFFGVSKFDRGLLEQITPEVMAKGADKDKSMLSRVWDAEERTEKVEAQLSELYERPATLVGSIARYGENADLAIKEYLSENAPELYKLAQSIDRRDPYGLTRGVNFDYHALKASVEQEILNRNLRKTDPEAAAEAERQALAEKDGDATQPETVPPSPLKDPKDPDGASMPWYVQFFKNVSTWLLDLGGHEPVSALPEGTERVASAGATDFRYSNNQPADPRDAMADSMMRLSPSERSRFAGGLDTLPQTDRIVSEAQYKAAMERLNKVGIGTSEGQKLQSLIEEYNTTRQEPRAVVSTPVQQPQADPLTGTSTGLKQAPTLEETYWAKVDELKALNARLNTADETAEDLFRADELQAELFEMEQQLKEQGKQEKAEGKAEEKSAKKAEIDAVEVPKDYAAKGNSDAHFVYKLKSENGWAGDNAPEGMTPEETRKFFYLRGENIPLFQLMTNEELKKYLYLDETDKGMAEDYLQQLGDERLFAEYRAQVEGRSEKFAKDSPILSSVASVGVNMFINPGESAAIFFEKMFYDKDVVKNDPRLSGTVAVNMIRQVVPENFSEFAKFLYGTGMSIADNLLNRGIFGPATLLTMGLAASANTMQNALDRGATSDEALLIGAISGIVEGATEKMQMERFTAALKSVKGAGAKTLISNLIQGGLKSAVPEGLEEGAAYILSDFVADLIIMGDKSEVAIKHKEFLDLYTSQGMTPEEADAAAWEETLKATGNELLLNIAGGALSGLFFGELSAISNAYNASMNTKAADTTFQKDNFTETDAFQLAAQAQNSNAKPDVMKQYQDKVLSTLKIDPKTVETLTQSLGLKKGTGLFDVLRKMTDLKVNPSRVAQSILKNKSDIQTVLDFARFNILKNTILPQTQNPEADAMVSRALLTATNLTFEERANNVQQSLDTMIGDMAELSAQMGKALEGTPTVNFTHTLRRWGQKGLIYVNSLIEAGQKDLAYRLQSLPSDSVAVIAAENNMEKLNVSQSDINAQLAAWELDSPAVKQNGEVRAEEQQVEVRTEELLEENQDPVTEEEQLRNIETANRHLAVTTGEVQQAQQGVDEAYIRAEEAMTAFTENPSDQNLMNQAEAAVDETTKAELELDRAKKSALAADEQYQKLVTANETRIASAQMKAEAQARKELEQRKQEEAKLRQQAEQDILKAKEKLNQYIGGNIAPVSTEADSAEQDYLALERDAIENEPPLTKQETPQQAPVVKAETADIESLADEYVKTQGADATPEEQAAARQKFIDKINARLSGKEPVFSEKSQQFMQKVEKKFGIKFVSDPNVKGAEEAYYDPTTNTIHLNANATQGDALAGVAMHELTHAAQNSGWYKQLSDTVVGILYKDEGSLERDIQAKIDRYAQDGKTLTSEQALQEIVAQGIRNKVFTDEASINRLLDMDVSLGQKILDVLNRILASFKGDSQILTARNLLEKALKDRGAPGQAQFSLSDTDQTYLSAVESGDTETAQEMVDEAAKASGYTVKAYHGTNVKDITEFETDAKATKPTKWQLLFGTHFTENPEYAEAYATKAKNSRGTSRTSEGRKGSGRVYESYLNTGNMLDIAKASIFREGDKEYELYFALPEAIRKRVERSRPGIVYETTEWEVKQGLPSGVIVSSGALESAFQFMAPKSAFNFLVEHGYQSVKYNAVYGAGLSKFKVDVSYIILDPSNIKLADPVTYDDAGSVIPLSQRFDTGKTDIRYSLSDDDMDAYIDNLISKYGAIPQGETPVNSAPVPQKTSQNENVRKYARTASESGVFTPEQQDEFKAQLVDGKFSYEPISDQSVLNKADNLFKRGGVDGLQQEWARAIGGDRIPSKAQMAAGERLLQEYAKANDTENTMKMVSELSEVLTRAGQTVQAARLLKRMTNAGQLYYLKRAINKINNDIKGDPIVLNPDLVNGLMKAKTDKERNDAIDALSKDAGKQIPPSWKTRLTAWRYFAMLGNPRTHIRNIIGNLAFMPAIKIKNIIGTGLEVFIKEKTKSASVSRDEYSEAYADAEAHISVLMSGGKYNPTNIINMNAPSFGNSLLGRGLEKVTQANMNALEAEDAWFLKRHYANALAGYLKANKLNLDTADEQTLTKARQYAVDEAKNGTYRDASAVASWLNEMSKKGGIPGIIIEGIMPFKKTPVNILKRGIEYSPIGLVDSLTRGVKQLKDGKITPAQFIDKVSSGLTGTMIAGLGYFLASLGAIKIGFKDDKEDEFKRLTGSQEFAVEIFDYSITLDWLVPSAMPLFVGATLFETSKEELTFDGALSALSKIMEPVFNLTMLDGVNRAIESASWSQDNPLTEVAINSAMNLLGQFIPTLLGQAARTIDPTRRKNYTDKNSSVPASIQRMLNTAKNKLPWLSEQSEPYLDVWGQEERTDSPWLRAFENFLSPAYINELTPDAVETMLMEVYKETGDPSVLPGTASKYFEVNNETINLTGPEYTRFSKVRGQAMYEAMEGLMNRESFQELEPRLKAKTLAKAIDYANQAGKLDINPNYNADSLTITAMKGDPATAIIENIVNADKDAKRSGYKIDAIKAITAGDVESASATYGALTLWYQDKYPDDSDKEIRDRVKNYLNDDKIKEQYRAAYADGDDDLMFLIEDTLAEIGIRYKYNDWLKDRTK